jgi:hypothetical protein
MGSALAAIDCCDPSGGHLSDLPLPRVVGQRVTVARQDRGNVRVDMQKQAAVLQFVLQHLKFDGRDHLGTLKLDCGTRDYLLDAINAKRLRSPG